MTADAAGALVRTNRSALKEEKERPNHDTAGMRGIQPSKGVRSVQADNLLMIHYGPVSF
jgi:hypothetical protein